MEKASKRDRRMDSYLSSSKQPICINRLIVTSLLDNNSSSSDFSRYFPVSDFYRAGQVLFSFAFSYD